MALAIFVPNLAGIHQPNLKLYQTADHPTLSPILAILSGEKKQQIILADLAPPKILSRKVRRLWCDVRGEVWFGSFSLPFLLFCFVL